MILVVIILSVSASRVNLLRAWEYDPMGLLSSKALDNARRVVQHTVAEE